MRVLVVSLMFVACGVGSVDEVTGDELTVGADLVGAGLTGAYFDNPGFAGPRLTRLDATVSFDWGAGAPASALPADTFWVRWTGTVTPRFSETYTFHVVADDGVRLWVNGVLIIDHWQNQPATDRTGTITLVAGRKYALRLEYYEDHWNASCQLLWESASQRLEVIPSSQLSGSAATASTCPGLSTLVEPPEQLYVAPAGNDSSSGDAAHPLATLAEAARRFPTGGTVIVRGGTYGSQTIVATGTQAHPLVIRAAAGETPIFDGADVTGSWSAVLRLRRADHVVLKGLEVRNCGASNCSGIAGPPVHDLTVRECHIHHTDGPGARFAGDTIVLEGNHFHDVALTNLNHNTALYPEGGWPTCIGTVPDDAGATWTNNVTIRNNRVEDCWGEGIAAFYGSNVLIEGNVVINAWNVGIYMDNAFNVTVRRNFVHMLQGKNGSQGSGILMGTEPYDKQGRPNSATHDVLIANNVVVSGGGISWWSSPETSSANTYRNVSVLHNTVIATRGGALGFAPVKSGLPLPSQCVARNNVLSEVGTSRFGNPGWVLAGNAWLNKPPPAGAADVSVSATVGAVVTATDVKPLAAVVGKGQPEPGVPTDHHCAPRDPAQPTRGAVERGALRHRVDAQR